MPDFMKMMKQAASMKKDLKQIQKDLNKRRYLEEAAGGAIKVTVRGDISVESIELAPEALGDATKLGRTLTATVNKAVAKAKKEAAGEMSKLTSGMGLGDMLGG